MKSHIATRLYLGLAVFAIFFTSSPLFAQDLLKQLEEASAQEKKYTFATFKGTRVVNGHSIETKGAGELEFIISHRFGRLNSGSYNFWGLDQAFIRIGLEYGVTDRLGIGVGRNSYNKIYDGYIKYKLLKQSSGPGSFPFSVTGFASVGFQTLERKSDEPDLEFFDRATYTYQLLLARKLTTKLSFQVSPTFVHSNRVDQTILNNDQFALGFGGRFKLTKSLAINAEYYLRMDPHPSSPYYDALGICFDIETGGHVFQLVVSNTQGMVERTFTTLTEGDFFSGDIHLGFNITRTFQLKKEK